MQGPSTEPTTILRNSLRNERIHSAYLFSGAALAARSAAAEFARGLACQGPADEDRPCERCGSCNRSHEPEDGAEGTEIDGSGKQGPLYRHIGEHPDLLWVERGAGDTRVRVGQVRAVQNALRLGANEGGWRAAVIADAEWLNLEAQNGLLRLLEEPPDRACLILLASSASALIATIRSRCVRVVFPAEKSPDLRSDGAEAGTRALVARLDGMSTLRLPDLLDWAEEYRGNRSEASERVQTLLHVGSEWLRERVTLAVQRGETGVRRDLDAFKVLTHCRRDLVQRNANPQMVAERGLIAVRQAVGS